MNRKTIQGVRIFLLVLIVIGLGLIAAQAYWVPSVVNAILSHEQVNSPAIVPPSPVVGTPAKPKNAPVPPASSGSVAGTVTIGPTCPVQQDPPSDACADKPYAATLVITGNGTTVTVQSDAQGHFAHTLAPGTYTIQSAGKGLLPRLAPVSFTVEKGKQTMLNLSFDSGIR